MTPQRGLELTDDQWTRLAPLLPPQRPRIGRPAKDHRTMLNGILGILGTGAPWRDLPERYGRWQQAGVREQVLTVRQAEAARDGTLDDALAMIDGTNMCTHHQAAGVRKKAAQVPGSAGAGTAGAVSLT